jgi:ferredoxin
MKVTIDRDQCIACGACYDKCPSVFEENSEDTWSQITVPYRVNGDLGLGEVPSELEPCAREGEAVCPVSIIHVG